MHGKRRDCKFAQPTVFSKALSFTLRQLVSVKKWTEMEALYKELVREGRECSSGG